MKLFLLSAAPALALVLAPVASSQGFPKIGYSSHEEYCRENPRMPTCIKGPKLDLKGWQLPAPATKSKPPTASSERPPQDVRDWRVPMSAEPLPAGQAQARFSPSFVGILLSIRPKAILESKWLDALAANWGGGPSQDVQAAVPLDEIRLAVGTRANARKSMLMMVSAPPAILTKIGDGFRSKGITACFVDVNTMLVGEYAEVVAAVERMLAPEGVRTSPSPLPGSEEIARDADFWLAARREFATANLTSGTGHQGLAEGVSGISMAMRLREGLDLDVLLHTTDAAVADKLLVEANREILRALNLEPTGTLPPEFLQSLKAAKTRHGVLMKLSLEASDIPAPLMEQMRSALAPLRGVLPNVETQQKRKPTIDGL